MQTQRSCEAIRPTLRCYESLDREVDRSRDIVSGPKFVVPDLHWASSASVLTAALFVEGIIVIKPLLAVDLFPSPFS